jgi:hypothetical protein
MHSTSAPSGQTYHHNGDYSGPVKMFLPVREQLHYPGEIARAGTPEKVPGAEGVFVEVEIPFEDMKALVMDHFRSVLISRLEDADTEAMERLFLGFVKEV